MAKIFGPTPFLCPRPVEKKEKKDSKNESILALKGILAQRKCETLFPARKT